MNKNSKTKLTWIPPKLILTNTSCRMNINYFKPAKYDDLLTIRTILTRIPGVKIDFQFEVLNEKNELLTTAEVVLVFIDMVRNKPTKAPEFIIQKIRQLL